MKGLKQVLVTYNTVQKKKKSQNTQNEPAGILILL